MRAVLVRHAAAGKRHAWTGDDRLRPLDDRGLRQAAGLVPVLTELGVDRLVSSPYARCVQTLAPAADAFRLEVEQREELAEGAGAEGFYRLVAELDGSAPALSTHGDVIHELLGEPMRKGAVRVLEVSDAGVRVDEAFPPAD